MDPTKAIDTMSQAGPLWALVVVLLVSYPTLFGTIWLLGKSVAHWSFNDDINPATGKPKGPLARLTNAHTQTMDNINNSIGAIKDACLDNKATSDKHETALANGLLLLNAKLKMIEDQLEKMDVKEQSIEMQRVMRLMISTMLDLAAAQGTDITSHRAKFMRYLTGQE